mmetsp:Transcript_17959/g.45498  ORF Transcript_17959/g.45498 Transcript_17959/m.45498 type:complete len:237 (-) Transcript_17959:761-1471(-)
MNSHKTNIWARGIPVEHEIALDHILQRGFVQRGFQVTWNPVGAHSPAVHRLPRKKRLSQRSHREVVVRKNNPVAVHDGRQNRHHLGVKVAPGSVRDLKIMDVAGLCITNAPHLDPIANWFLRHANLEPQMPFPSQHSFVEGDVGAWNGGSLKSSKQMGDQLPALRNAVLAPMHRNKTLGIHGGGESSVELLKALKSHRPPYRTHSHERVKPVVPLGRIPKNTEQELQTDKFFDFAR